MMNDITSAYVHVVHMERPWEAIRNFGNSLALISETLEETGQARSTRSQLHLLD